MNRIDGAGFPIPAGILFGLGLGGFFDGIVLHQILQWHHMLTDAGYPATSVENLKINTFWDGLFHATTYIFVVMGLIVLWRASRRRHIRWSASTMSTRQCRASSGSCGTSAFSPGVLPCCSADGSCSRLGSVRPQRKPLTHVQRLLPLDHLR